MATIVASTMFLHDHFDAWLLIVLMHVYSLVACMVRHVLMDGYLRFFAWSLMSFL